MRSLLTALYVLSGTVLLVIPVLQVRLHWNLAQLDTAQLPRLAARNHILLLSAAASVAGLYYFVDPGANIRVDLLLAIPFSALILLLWGMFMLRLSHAKR
jgi:hypothetical protein